MSPETVLIEPMTEIGLNQSIHMIQLRITLSFLTMFLTSVMTAQSITGTVVQEDGSAVSFASVSLRSMPDSTLQKVGYTEDDGTFLLATSKPGSYFVEVSYVGFKPSSTNPFEFNGSSMDLGEVLLGASLTTLDEVTVRGKKPIVEVQPDKTRFNIEGSINAQGSNTFDLLRKAPGVIVDNNDNISLLGKNGVRIYINGRPSPLAGDDLAAYLRSLNATDISSIDIITNPSSKYEAQGNAGIIDIRLKKNQKFGSNMTLNAGFAQGITPKGNASFNANYRNNIVNLFGGYSYWQGINHNYANFYREQVGFIYEASNDIRRDAVNHGARLGADFFLNDRHTLGFMASTNFNNPVNKTRTVTRISDQATKEIDRWLVSGNTEDNERNSYDFNLNYSIDAGEGRSWNMDVDYGIFTRRSEGVQPNIYYGPDRDDIIEEANYNTNTPTDVNIYSFKLDHVRPVGEAKLSLGVKSIRVITDNEYGFYNNIDGELDLDTERSNMFVYDEWVNAGYIHYQRQFGKFGIQAGVRAEYTRSEGDLEDLEGNQLNNTPRDYLDFFPSAGVSYNLNPKNSFNLTYSRRIDRPNYQDLNPFEFKLSELSFRKGNAFLNPQYTHSIQLSHTFNYRLNTTLSYSYIDDFFAQLIDTINQEASFIMIDNLATRQVYNANVSYPFSINQWWNAYLTMGGTYVMNKADYGDGKKVDLNVPFFNMYGQTSFLLPHNFSLELSGWYRSGGVWGGIFKSQAIGGMDAGLQWKFDDDRGSIKLSMGDLFRTMMWGGKSDFGAQYVEANGGWEARQYRINVSYTIGNQKVKTRKRKTGLDEEKGRLNDSGGQGR
ncbi:MAG: TonB-dependent receptor [Saprospiraceae bacterium]|nr:TonB-dependent receptor [Saprospiraceae bacterium]